MQEEEQGGEKPPPVLLLLPPRCRPTSRQSPPVKWRDDYYIAVKQGRQRTSDWGTRGVKEGQEEKELVGRSRSVRVKVEEVELGSERVTQTNSSPRAVASLIMGTSKLDKLLEIMSSALLATPCQAVKSIQYIENLCVHQLPQTEN